MDYFKAKYFGAQYFWQGFFQGIPIIGDAFEYIVTFRRRRR